MVRKYSEKARGLRNDAEVGAEDWSWDLKMTGLLGAQPFASDPLHLSPALPSRVECRLLYKYMLV
jgi:hypothetical protein